MIYLIVIASLLIFTIVYGSEFEAFQSTSWMIDVSSPLSKSTEIEFIVALNLRNVDEMQQEFFDVSNPQSDKYGKFYDIFSLQRKYGALPSTKQAVIEFFRSIPGARVKDSLGDFITVTAKIQSIESKLDTQIEYMIPVDSSRVSNRGSYRAVQNVNIPNHIKRHISFISLIAPILNLSTRLSKEVMTTYPVSVTTGNEEALVQFTAICSDLSVNNFNPPCSNFPIEVSPRFQFSITQSGNNLTDQYPLTTNPTEFTVSSNSVYCYDTLTKGPCNGRVNATCRCIAKLSPLPKYTQLRVNVSSTFDTSFVPVVAYGVHYLGSSALFALTDTATSATLSYLYQIPSGMRARYGSNQSVAEFYGEFYSNSDLASFLSYSGLKNASIPDSNVFGDLPNNQAEPGGEAQLDVEYIMSLAPGADTFFYSFSDLNPTSSNNEGFLAYLTVVSGQPYPPLVHSLSYGDIEAQIFNTSNNGSISYGQRCDQEFMKMGLRGLTVVFSSGDDGIGNVIVRDDPIQGCSQAYPSWPATSPYVTTVGATQLSNQYLPICEANYAVGTSYPYLPEDLQLQFQCTAVKETTCSSSIGGVITSGGGFSNVYDRITTAPWQNSAVQTYLKQGDNTPPYSYFNESGRAYPDISTYGSNYFVFLNNTIVRESGTSASAPVFASMVTLWNDMRLAYGQSPMGFIAPFLYQIYSAHPEAFHDITTGNNACAAGHSLDTVNCCEYSFKAAPGWDATTGLGSPNFQVIANLVLNTSTPYPAISASAATNSYIIETNSDDDGGNYDSADKSLTVAALVLAIYASIVSSVLLGIVGYYVLFKRTSGSLREPLIDSSSSRGLMGETSGKVNV